MTKYKEFFQLMIADNKELFDEFNLAHSGYDLNPQRNQDKFNEIGSKVMKVIKEYEGKLCGHSEGAGYASFSGNLAQKFQDEVRRAFPKIDCVGIIATPPAGGPAFSLKKINLL